MIIVSYIVFALFSSENGLVNKSIMPLLGRPSIHWYSERKYWPVILTITYLWKNLGFYTIIYYSSVIAIY
jgi:putative aldouronate transport system permease protein